MIPVADYTPLLHKIERSRSRWKRLRELHPGIECFACHDEGTLNEGTHLVADAEGNVTIEPKSIPCPICEKGKQVEREREGRAWIERVGRECGVPAKVRSDAQSKQFDDGHRERLLGCLRQDRGAYLFGPVRTGKSTVAAAVLREFVGSNGDVRRSPRAYGIYVTASDYLQGIRDTYGDGTDRVHRSAATGGGFQSPWNAKLLVLDDLGLERSTEWGAEQIATLVDHRSSNGLPTIYTSNLNLNQIEAKYNRASPHMGARIASRIAGTCEVIQVAGPDRRRAGK